MQGHTDLKGGAITSTQAAIDNNKNSFNGNTEEGMVLAPTAGADTAPAHVLGDDGLDLRQLEHLMAHGLVAVAIASD